MTGGKVYVYVVFGIEAEVKVLVTGLPIKKKGQSANFGIGCPSVRSL